MSAQDEAPPEQKKPSEPMCIGNHDEPKPAEYDSPADLCEACWLSWFCRDWPS